jgi:hypothetical protein
VRDPANDRLPSPLPCEATAEQGVVLLDGPQGVVMTLTPEAAHATGENLRRAASAATRQRLAEDKTSEAGTVRLYLAEKKDV